MWPLGVCVRACVCVCVRACVRACVRVCVRACVCFWLLDDLASWTDRVVFVKVEDGSSVRVTLQVLRERRVPVSIAVPHDWKFSRLKFSCFMIGCIM